MNIRVINGPNLNLLGTREPDLYGRDTLETIEARAQTLASSLNVTVEFLQSNYEGQIVEWIQGSIGRVDAIIINAAAYTHTSVAIHDALKCYPGFKLELHISNPHMREPFRHNSFISTAVDAVVMGFGANGYEEAIRVLAERST